MAPPPGPNRSSGNNAAADRKLVRSLCRYQLGAERCRNPDTTATAATSRTTPGKEIFQPRRTWNTPMALRILSPHLAGKCANRSDVLSDQMALRQFATDNRSYRSKCWMAIRRQQRARFFDSALRACFTPVEARAWTRSLRCAMSRHCHGNQDFKVPPPPPPKKKKAPLSGEAFT